jgi:predicted metal-dependent hydrolase
MAGRTVTRTHELGIDGQTLRYTLYRVAGRKHVHLVVGEDASLQVRAPWRYSAKSAEELVLENRRWVLDALEKARRSKVLRVPLVSGSELPLLDERLRLQLRAGAQLDLLPGACPRGATRKVPGVLRRPEGWIARRGSLLKVEPSSLSQSATRSLVEAWYRREARRRLPARLIQFAEHVGLRPNRVSIRAQRTRWGSCSSQGTICLNWRLLLLPSELSDYILVHELCHLRHLDHSRRFWRLVGSIIPDYAARERRLDAMQSGLAL